MSTRPPRFSTHDLPEAGVIPQMDEALTVTYGGSIPFKWKTESGELLGPYGPLAYCPPMIPLFFELAKTTYLSDMVKPRNRELAILGLVSILDAPDIASAHRLLAAQIGISNQQWSEGLAGAVPQGLTAEEAMAYELGRRLTRMTTKLDEETWNATLCVLEKREIVGIIHTVAGYKWVAMLSQVNGDNGLAEANERGTMSAHVEADTMK